MSRVADGIIIGGAIVPALAAVAWVVALALGRCGERLGRWSRRRIDREYDRRGES